MEWLGSVLDMGGPVMMVAGSLFSFLLAVWGAKGAMTKMYKEWKDVLDTHKAAMADGHISQDEMGEIINEVSEAVKASLPLIQIVKGIVKGIFRK